MLEKGCWLNAGQIFELLPDTYAPSASQVNAHIKVMKGQAFGKGPIEISKENLRTLL